MSNGKTRYHVWWIMMGLPPSRVHWLPHYRLGHFFPRIIRQTLHCYRISWALSSQDASCISTKTNDQGVRIDQGKEAGVASINCSAKEQKASGEYWLEPGAKVEAYIILLPKLARCFGIMHWFLSESRHNGWSPPLCHARLHPLMPLIWGTKLC